MNPRRDILLLVGLGLGTRLAALPWAMTQDADAVSRVLLARQWLEAPALITHGVWGPLHTYLIGAALTLWNDPVLAPILFGIAFSVAAAAALYAFTREEFDPRAALPVACAYLLYPVAFRNSLMALPEGPFTFFVVTGLWLAGRARRPEGRAGQAAAAGVALTLAGALRFEAWLLMPLIGAAMVSRGAGRRVAIFLFCAALFPAFWLAGCARATGDPLFSIHYTTRYLIENEGYNAHVTAMMRLIRVGFYPFTLFCGLTPPVFLLCLGGLGLALARRRPYARWAAVPLGLVGLLVFKSFQGEITAKGRYIHLAGVLALPFLAPALEWLRGRWGGGAARLTAILAIAAMAPLSYIGLAAPGMLGTFYQKNIALIPRVPAPGPQVAALVEAEAARGARALLSDFFGWAETSYMVYRSRLTLERIWQMPGARYETPDFSAMEQWLKANPAGILVLKEGSALAGRLRAERGLEIEQVGLAPGKGEGREAVRVRVCRYRRRP